MRRMLIRFICAVWHQAWAALGGKWRAAYCCAPTSLWAFSAWSRGAVPLSAFFFQNSHQGAAGEEAGAVVGHRLPPLLGLLRQWGQVDIASQDC